MCLLILSEENSNEGKNQEVANVNSKLIRKIAIDFGMTVLLMLLMAFELIGRAAHEWIGMGMFALFIIHHALNWNWSKNLFHGKYTVFRLLQTISAASVLILMIGSFVSSILISREIFSFLPITGGRVAGRSLHMICAYWGLLALAFHLGIHWNTMMRIAGRICSKPSRLRSLILKITGVGIAGYGIYAFIQRDFPEYMFLQTPFVFFDFDEPVIFFFGDYIAIMGLMLWIGHYFSKLLMWLIKRRCDRSNHI